MIDNEYADNNHASYYGGKDNTYEWINVETQKEQEIKQYHYKEMPVASEDYKEVIRFAQAANADRPIPTLVE